MVSAGKALVLIGAASLAAMMWLSVPLVVSGFPPVWRCFVSWLRPPYVYVLLNGIIVTIAASSRMGSSRGRLAEAPPPPPPPCSYHSYGGGDFGSATSEDLRETSQLIPAACMGSAGSGVGEDKGGKDEEEEDGAEAEEFDDSRAALVPSLKQAKREDTENVPPEEAEKPLVSSRLSHRRPVKLSSPEGGKVLGVAKPRRQETLENTWRSITEGRQMPLTRHLKKCESSLENRVGLTPTNPQNPKAIKKSATFRDRTNEMPMQVEESRAPASLTRDELNQRVEAFIRKFNEEMRLQRQESLDQYRALMVSRRI